MSIQITKQGIMDTLQDKGRYGFQHIGIPPCGFLDYLSAQLANVIVGNPKEAPIFELHFPASSFIFNEAHTICISGANFVPVLNYKSIALNTPIQVCKNDTLHFMQPLLGKTSYLSIKGNIDSNAWLNSKSDFSSHIKNNDQFKIIAWDGDNKIKSDNTAQQESQQYSIDKIQKHIFNSNEIRFIPGPQWNDLTNESISNIIKQPFNTSLNSNRMGYTLKGPSLQLIEQKSYLSSAVTRGTMQLLPSGEVIVLMANHQTIGGYANIGQIILVDLPKLVQHKSELPFRFSISNVETAHSEYIQMQKCFSQY
jgi:antagonist of KipI